MGRVGDPGSDLAPVIELLGTDEAHFLTAGTLVTDGGLWMGLSSASTSPPLLQGKTVIVTGAGGGVGWASRLASRDARGQRRHRRPKGRDR